MTLSASVSTKCAVNSTRTNAETSMDAYLNSAKAQPEPKPTPKAEKKPAEKKAEPKKELSVKDKLLIEAKNGLKNYINDRARNPETFKTSDMRVEYLSDSACVIKFRFVAENQFGGHVNEKAQWIWLKYNGDTYQSWQDTSDDDICEFGKPYLRDDDELDPSLTIVCLDVIETDQYARSLLVKNNVLSFDNSYGVLYCIIKKIGEKVKENKNTDISSLKTW